MGLGEHKLIYLALGILLWAGAHLSTTLRMGFRSALIAKMDAKKYKGVFALVILVSLVLIVVGWRSTPSLHLYDPPLWNSPLMILFLWIAFFLMAASGGASNVKRFIRNPQLTGVIVWAGAHLLANGDNRSVLLFGGLGLWAILEIILLNRRDGPWEKPGATPIKRDLMLGVLSAVVVVVLMMLHPFFTGMKLQFGA